MSLLKIIQLWVINYYDMVIFMLEMGQIQEMYYKTHVSGLSTSKKVFEWMNELDGNSFCQVISLLSVD